MGGSATASVEDVNLMDNGGKCDVCHLGSMSSVNHRCTSATVAGIGRALLALSLLGLVVGTAVFVNGLRLSWRLGESMTTQPFELREAAVPEPIIEQVVADQAPTDDELKTLKESQLRAVQKAMDLRNTRDYAKHFSAQVFLALLVISVVLCFIGRRLTMKKRVLRCTACMSVVPLP